MTSSTFSFLRPWRSERAFDRKLTRKSTNQPKIPFVQRLSTLNSSLNIHQISTYFIPFDSSWPAPQLCLWLRDHQTDRSPAKSRGSRQLNVKIDQKSIQKFPPTKIQFPPNEFISSSRKQVQREAAETLHAPKPRPPAVDDRLFFSTGKCCSPPKCSSSFWQSIPSPRTCFLRNTWPQAFGFYLQHFSFVTPPPCPGQGESTR